MTALFVLLTMIVTGMNIINYNTVVTDAVNTLSLLSKNQGAFPEFLGNNIPKNMTPETPYESRYFSVLLNTDNHVIQTDTSRIKAIDSDKAIKYAEIILKKNKEQGFIDNYRFLCNSEGSSTRIIFLDCSKKMEAFRSFLLISISMALFGYILFFFVLVFFSGKIIRPVSESYEKQKQFITDAGHEIKTPLTIIQADADVLKLDIGQNKWLDDIQNQTTRLATLTNDLVYLSRMEESREQIQMIEFPFSDIVEEVALPFQALAQMQNKIFTYNIEPMLSLVGNEKNIRQLISILMDNAMKYSPENGMVSISAEKQGRQIKLTVINNVEAPVPKERLPLIFERFYRMDSSRNTQTGGYGIGLSVAKAIVTAHNGKISVTSKNENSLEITAQFPIQQTQTKFHYIKNKL